MNEAKSGPSRGEMRSWLKRLNESGLLDLLPPTYAPPCGGTLDTAEAAGDLLARLRAEAGGLRPNDPLWVEFRAFRRWVEAQRQAQRALTLNLKERRATTFATEPDDPTDESDPGDRAAAGAKPRRDDPKARASPFGRAVQAALGAVGRVISRRRRAPDLDDPLWDRWMD